MSSAFAQIPHNWVVASGGEMGEMGAGVPHPLNYGGLRRAEEPGKMYIPSWLGKKVASCSLSMMMGEASGLQKKS